MVQRGKVALVTLLRINHAAHGKCKSDCLHEHSSAAREWSGAERPCRPSGGIVVALAGKPQRSGGGHWKQGQVALVTLLRINYAPMGSASPIVCMCGSSACRRPLRGLRSSRREAYPRFYGRLRCATAHLREQPRSARFSRRSVGTVVPLRCAPLHSLAPVSTAAVF